MSSLMPIKWPKTVFLSPMRMSPAQKLVVMSIATGVTLLAVLSRLLRRRKTTRAPVRTRRYQGRRTRSSIRSPNDLISLAGSRTSARSASPVGSLVAYSDRLSVASSSLGGGGTGTTRDVSSHQSNILNSAVVGGTTSRVNVDANGTIQLTSQQLGVMGMEALDTVINFWEDALAVHYSPSGISNMLTTAEDSEFCREIQNLLDMACTLQEQGELLFLDQRSVLFREEQSIAGMSGTSHGSINNRDETIHKFNESGVSTIAPSGTGSGTGETLNRVSSDPNFDSAESFASALDQVADLRDFEGLECADHSEFPFYQNALQQHEECSIPYRTLFTDLTHCSNDTEYLVKLHCIRLAFQYLFTDPAISQWVIDTGRQILTDLLCVGDKDTKEFLVGYEDMMKYIQDASNWTQIQKELNAREVKVMTFYDICLDFIILDSLQDLNAPPASVIAVVQNRFLSNGFKETALTTAVWSVLKAKRRMLQYPNGFMAHFYVISEQISPLMAWGFFGPDEHLKSICHYFRDQMLGFLEDIFSFQKSRYTTLEHFSEDILQHMKDRVNNISVKFSQ